jgi:hypothetical protein
MPTENTPKKCFIITPIGSDKSDIRRHAEGVINEVLRPILENDPYNFIVIYPKEVSTSGSITRQVIKDIYESDLVIANLTSLNPNVMYELSFRHACAKPIIHICERGTDLPFDIKDHRTIFYDNDMTGALELKSDLIRMLNCIDDYSQDNNNPIYNSLFNISIDKLINLPEVASQDKAILKLLNDISQDISLLKIKNSNSSKRIAVPDSYKFSNSYCVTCSIPNDMKKDIDDLVGKMHSEICLELERRNISIQDLNSGLDGNILSFTFIVVSGDIPRLSFLGSIFQPVIDENGLSLIGVQRS